MLDEACDYRRTGAYSLSRDSARLEKLASAAQTLAAHGQEVRRLGPTELPLPGFAGGYWYAGDGQLDPVQLLSSLRRQCGASILEGVNVQGLDPGADRVLVRTDLGELRASNVVLATNAYTPDLCDALAPWVRPVRAQALATAPVSLRLPGPIYALDDWAYLRQDSEARVILGGFRPLAAEEEVGTQDHLHPAVHGALDGYRAPRLPSLHDTRARKLRWSGALGYAPDALPVIGEVPGLPGAHFVGAHSGHGLGWGFVAGRMLAALLTEGTRPGPWMRDGSRPDRRGHAPPTCRGRQPTTRSRRPGRAMLRPVKASSQADIRAPARPGSRPWTRAATLWMRRWPRC